MKYSNKIFDQAGQGVVSFLVVVIFFLVPAILGLSYMVKIGEAKHNSLNASRYAAWERTVWHQNDSNYSVKSDLEISREINQRVFSRQDATINSTQDKAQVGSDSIDYDPILYSWSSDRERIIEMPDGAQEPNQLSIVDSPAGGVVMDSVTSLLGLSKNGFYNSQITLQLYKDSRLQEEFDSILGENVEFVSATNNAILVGAWNAKGPEGVRRTVRRTMPSSLLDGGIADLVTNVATLIGFEEFDDLDFGRVDSERVPCSRVAGSGKSGRGC